MFQSQPRCPSHLNVTMIEPIAEFIAFQSQPRCPSHLNEEGIDGYIVPEWFQSQPRCPSHLNWTASRNRRVFRLCFNLNRDARLTSTRAVATREPVID